MEISEQKNRYEEAQEKISILEVVIQPEDIARSCKEIADILKSIGDYEDATELEKFYRQKAEEVQKKALKDKYDKAERIISKAKNVSDYDRGIRLFRELKGYSDAQEKADHYRNVKMNYIKKQNIRMAVSIVLLIAVVALGVFAVNRWMEMKQQEIEMQADPAAAAEKAAKESEAAEKARQESEAAENAAKESESAAKTAADADVQTLDNCKVGDKVFFGKYKWKVCDLKGKEAFLIAVESDKYEDLSDKAFHDKEEDVTWENSSLRAWLNGEFLQNGFTEEERAQIVLSTIQNKGNSRYHGEDQPDTQDYIYLFSEQEAEEYWKQIKGFSLYWLLRTNGKAGDSVMYLSPGHEISSYGVGVADKMYLRPVMWVTIP